MRFRILHYDTLISTNDSAKELAEAGAGEGTVVLADYQTRGRGQFRRRWHSPKGKDLLFSIIVRPAALRANAVSLTTQIAAMSVRDALQREFDLPSKIKRPNDILVDGRKICGILVEGSTRSNTVEYLIVGIGININSAPKELVRGATSLCAQLGKEQDREGILKALLRAFDVQYAQFLALYNQKKGAEELVEK